VLQFEKLKAAGFHVTLDRYSDSVGFFAALAYKYLDKSGTVNKDSVKVYDRFIYPLSIVIDKIASRFFGKNVEAIAVKK
jgi:hypothetical protein